MKVKVGQHTVKLPENIIAIQPYRFAGETKIFGKIQHIIDKNLVEAEEKHMSNIKTNLIRENVRASLGITDRKISDTIFLRMLRATPFKS